MSLGATAVLLIVLHVDFGQYVVIVGGSSSDMNNSNWIKLGEDQKGMVNTNMVITCPSGYNCTELKSTPGANMVSPIAMFLTGTIGNAVALFVLYRNSRREQMRTVFYLLCSVLAWTDLTGIVLTTIPVLTVYLNGRWVGSTGLCNYHAFTMISIGLITPCMVCTMAIERFLGIRHGYFYKKHVSRSRVRFILLTQWIVVLVYTSLPFFGFGQYSRQYPGTWCFFDIHATHILHQAYALLWAVFIIILILVIIICNIAVIATLIRMRYKRTHLNSPSLERQVHKSPRQREIELQMVILLVGITLLFTTCWLPFMLQIILNQLVDYERDRRLDIVTIRLLSINQTFHPWLYVLCRKVIFKRFWMFLRRLVPSTKRTFSSKNIQQEGRQNALMSPTFRVQLPPPDVTAGVTTRAVYCQKCESLYGDGGDAFVSPLSKKTPVDYHDGLELHATAAATSSSSSSSSSTTMTTTKAQQNGDNDSAFDIEDYHEELDSSIRDSFRKSSGQMTKCQNCKQVIDNGRNSLGSLERKSLEWKPRPEALLSVSFLKKHSKRSLSSGCESSVSDNSRTVRSAVM